MENTNTLRHPAHRTNGRPGLFAMLRQALALRRHRRDLARLDDSRLRDIGLSREEASIEAARPIWDVPQSWLR